MSREALQTKRHTSVMNVTVLKETLQRGNQIQLTQLLAQKSFDPDTGDTSSGKKLK